MHCNIFVLVPTLWKHGKQNKEDNYVFVWKAYYDNMEQLFKKNQP